MIELMQLLGIQMSLTSIVSLAAIVFFGLPHGAFDGAVALSLGFGKTPILMLAFVFLYLLIAVSVVFFWINFPEISLISFLIFSAFHFGMGDSQDSNKIDRAKQILTHGGLVVVGISVFHHDETNMIFSYLTDGQTFLVWQFIEIYKFILFPVILLYFIETFYSPVLRIRFLELVLLGIVFYLLPPLVGFSIYFCGIHSIRHINYTWLKLRSKKYTIQTIIYLAITFTITSWLLGVLLFWQLPTANFIDAALLKTVFIGLAALTVPHMLLVDGIFRQSD